MYESLLPYQYRKEVTQKKVQMDLEVKKVVSWLLLLGRAGPVNDLVALLSGKAQALNVYSLWGMVLIEGVGFVPLTFLLMSAVLRSTDAAFEEAAADDVLFDCKNHKDIKVTVELDDSFCSTIFSSNFYFVIINRTIFIPIPNYWSQ